MEVITFIPQGYAFEDSDGAGLALVMGSTEPGEASVGPLKLTPEESTAVLNVINSIARRESGNDLLPTFDQFMAGVPFPSPDGADLDA